MHSMEMQSVGYRSFETGSAEVTPDAPKIVVHEAMPQESVLVLSVLDEGTEQEHLEAALLTNLSPHTPSEETP